MNSAVHLKELLLKVCKATDLIWHSWHYIVRQLLGISEELESGFWEV